MATVDIGKVRPTFEGEWLANRTYEAMSIVMRNGTAYQSARSTPISALPENENSIYWFPIGRSGENGVDGADGKDGEMGPPWPQPPISDSITAPDSATYASSMAVYTLNAVAQDVVTSVAELGGQLTEVINTNITDINASIAETQAKLDTQIAELTALITARIPRGIITMWSGSATDIPTGWALCNGNNGTPYLMNRFVVAAGDTYSPHATGGANTHEHTLTVNGHTLTAAQMPTHGHSLPTYIGTLGSTGSMALSTGDVSYSHAATATNGGGMAHSHVAWASWSNNIPLYYALAYIMKL